jgi:PAS domain S-box-containing protein
LRLGVALLLLAFPLAVAVWAFGNYAAQRERSNADQRLAGGLTAAAGAYRNELADAARRARRLAGTHPVQRAFFDGRPGELRRLEREQGNVRLVRGTAAGAGPSSAAARMVPVVARGRTVGWVIALVPFDRHTVGRLTEAAGLAEGQRLAIARGGSVIFADAKHPAETHPRLRHAGDLRTGGLSYRAVAMLLSGHAGTELLALERSSRIDAAASSARWRVIGVGFGLIAALLAIAYSLAPAIARSRVTRQQRDQAEHVLDHVGDGIFLVDRDGLVRLWNPAAEAITGLRAGAVCNKPAEETIPGWASIAALVPLASKPGDHEHGLGAETVPLDIGDDELWLSIVGVSLAEGTVYAFRDVTRERRLEELRSDFVATISHELRTPLASLHGAALTLREHGDGLDSWTQHELLDMIAVQSRRLADLVEEILVTGQLDSGSLRVVSEPFDPEELVWSVASATRLRVGEETTIDVSATPGLPKVKGDAERTRQVLTNLLDNAIKYSPAGGRIDIAVEAEGERVRFMVRDEGLGIPLGEQERIFDKFYRLDPNQRRGIGGSGLGLYICRELVRSMNGRIWVRSDPGEGAIFMFDLPVAERVPTAA